MHEKVQLGPAVAAHHEFCVLPDLLRGFGAVLAADKWLIELFGQRFGNRGSHAGVSLEQVSHLIHTRTPDVQVMQNRHHSFADE
jgi:hypothetical protein